MKRKSARGMAATWFAFLSNLGSAAGPMVDANPDSLAFDRVLAPHFKGNMPGAGTN